jgi:hypothetical protein
MVPWQVDPPKAVALLEIAEAVSLLFSVGEVAIQEVSDLPLGAGSDGAGDQRLHRGFVPMLNH